MLPTSWVLVPAGQLRQLAAPVLDWYVLTCRYGVHADGNQWRGCNMQGQARLAIAMHRALSSALGAGLRRAGVH